MATEMVANRRRIIRRPRLTKLLDESPARIKLLIAPAGYGKTTLAQEWLSDPERQDVWYRGGPAAADVAALAVGLSVAASEVVPEAGKRMRERLRATGHPEEDVEILAELLAEDLQPWPDHAWLAIDDYQFAMESAASERFVDLVTQQTPLQLVVTSRRRPAWASARRILYGEMQQIDRRVLAMEQAEAKEVLGARDSRAHELVERAQGWPAVLGIAALMPHYTSRPDDLPDELYDYFAEELYRGINVPLRNALHRLALVPAVTTDFFHRLFGSQASKLIEDCSRIGATTLSDGQIALHPLLQTFLTKKQARENPDELRSTAEELADLLISLEEWDAAFQVVSTYASPELAIPLIEAAQAHLLADGRTQTLLAWLDFAARHHYSNAVLDFAEAEVLFRQGRHARAEALAAQAVSRVKGARSAKMLIRAGQAAVMNSRDDKGLEYFRAAQESATEEVEKLEAAVGTCFAALELGFDDEASEAMCDLSAIEPRGIDIAARKAIVELVYSARTGGVKTALDIGAEIMPLLEDARDPLIVTSFLNCYAHLLGLGALYQDALDVAEREASEAKRYRLQLALPHACLNRAVSYCGLRDFAKASAEIENAETLAGPGDIHVTMHGAALRARLALSRQKYEEALAQASQTWERQASAPMMAEYLAYRSLSQACLGNAHAAREMAIKAREIHATSVETVTLSACAEAVASLATNEPNAPSGVFDAYAIIHASGGLDTLVTVARAFPRFLEVLLEDEKAAEASRSVFARSNDFRLASAFGLDVGSTQLGPHGLLTSREAEVAYLVAQGRTNQEIAGHLFISLSTVKVHVRHIMQKLKARTRAEVAGRIMAD